MDGPWNPGLETPVPERLRPLCTLLRPGNTLTSIATARERRDWTGLDLPDTVALRHAVALQRVGQPQHPRGHLLVGDASSAVAGDQRFAVGQDGAADREDLSRIHLLTCAYLGLPLKRY